MKKDTKKFYRPAYHSTKTKQKKNIRPGKQQQIVCHGNERKEHAT